MRSSKMRMDNLAKALAILIVEEGNYSYVDRIGYAPSKGLALFYIREALRDLHSLIRSGEVKAEGAKELLRGLDFNNVYKEIEDVEALEDREDLREALSVLASKALTLSASALKRGW